LERERFFVPPNARALRTQRRFCEDSETTLVNPAENGFSNRAKFAGKLAESPFEPRLVIENESCRWNPEAVAIRLEP
jgi:hypothetical protein